MTALRSSAETARAIWFYQALAGFLSRSAFLQLLAAVDVAMYLPHKKEGSYLPALKAMASVGIAVTLGGL